MTHYKPTLELLETRDCPAVAYTFADGMGNVLLAGTTTGAGIAVGSVAGNLAVDGVDSGVPAADVASFALTGDPASKTIDLSGVDAVFSALASATVSGGSGSANTLDYSGNTDAHDFTVGALNAGNVDGIISFTSIQYLRGGAPSPGQNAYRFTANGSSLIGSLHDAGGNGKLDYTGRSSAVRVNLAAGTATAIGGIAGIADVTGTSGNDILTGDSADNVLDGGTGGNNILIGGGGGNTLVTHGTGRNLLIGGSGSTVFSPGSAGGDLVVGGSTAYDGNLTALVSLQLEWALPATSYANRIAHLTGALSGGLNGRYQLTAATVTTIGGETPGDGNTGLNWFILAAADAAILSPKAGETVTVY